MLSISAAFDAGNIKVVSTTATTAVLEIKPDPPTELEKKSHLQWFYFRATAAEPGAVHYEITNAATVSFPEAWDGTQVCVSTDRRVWTRVETTRYDGERGALCWSYEHTASTPSVYFAYFDPYDYERQLELVARCAVDSGARVRSLGQTLDGRELDCVEVGHGPLHCWVIHRQHPGETQASFYAEGLLTRLLGLQPERSVACSPDGLALRLRRLYTFHVVPNMNPDGGVRGHLRTNACGANLNREWTTTVGRTCAVRVPCVCRACTMRVPRVPCVCRACMPCCSVRCDRLHAHCTPAHLHTAHLHHAHTCTPAPRTHRCATHARRVITPRLRSRARPRSSTLCAPWTRPASTPL